MGQKTQCFLHVNNVQTCLLDARIEFFVEVPFACLGANEAGMIKLFILKRGAKFTFQGSRVSPCCLNY